MFVEKTCDAPFSLGEMATLRYCWLVCTTLGRCKRQEAEFRRDWKHQNCVGLLEKYMDLYWQIGLMCNDV